MQDPQGRRQKGGPAMCALMLDPLTLNRQGPRFVQPFTGSSGAAELILLAVVYVYVSVYV